MKVESLLISAFEHTNLGKGKLKMTEKQRANLQRRFDKANARTKRTVDEYRNYINGKKFRLIPENTATAIVIDECVCDTQFLTFWENQTFYVKTYDNGYGYTEWREITAREWRKINRLELAILDAWDAENELYYALKADE